MTMRKKKLLFNFDNFFENKSMVSQKTKISTFKFIVYVKQFHLNKLSRHFCYFCCTKSVLFIKLFTGVPTMLAELDELPSIQLGDYTLRFELEELNQAGQETSERELRETKENKDYGIMELKKLLEQGMCLLVY